MGLYGAFSFLSDLPSDIPDRIDERELLPPTSALTRLREQLESELGAYVMIYRSSAAAPAPGKVHLCSVLAPGRVDPAQLDRLKRTERAFRHLGMRFVAYAKPLRLCGLALRQAQPKRRIR
jgi:hypothetical protein